jgi:acyl-CoA dehydrogenase
MKLPEECVMIKQLAKRFVEEELIPLEGELEENGDLSPETWVTLKKKAAAVGLYMCMMPKEYGGGEISWLAAIGVWEEFGRVSPVFERTILTNPGAEVMQFKLPSQDQLERFFLPLMRGEKTMCFALTEPDAGNDVSMIKTRAVKQGGQWVINGTKTFITLAPKADFLLVLAVSDPSKGVREGTSCFIVEKGTPGFRVERTPKYMGAAGFKSSELVFEDCAVPEANLLGRENAAYREILRLLGASRILGGALSLGAAKRSLEIATDYALHRVTWGKPLAARQYVQGMLVDSAVQIYATECMLYDAAWEVDHGNQDPATQAIVKLFATEMAANVCERAMRVCGGHGYTKDMPLERMYRDTRGIMIADGASEVLKLIIAARLVGRKFAFEA